MPNIVAGKPGGLRAAFGCLVSVLLLAVIAPALAAPAAVSAAQHYSTEDLMRGFALTVFGREGPRSGREAGVYVNKFVNPLSVYIVDNSAIEGRAAESARFVSLLAKTVPNLRIRTAKKPDRARIFLFLVKRADYQSAITSALPNSDQSRFLKGNRCSTIMWDRTTGVLDHAYVFVVADEGDAPFTSCLAEELTQALGPANDNDSLVDSLYNDSNNVGTFGLFDWFILSALYDDDILPGMTKPEALVRLPAIIKRLRVKAGAVETLLPASRT